MSAFETEIDVRFRDVDAMGHVNNAVYATYMEQARADYFAAIIGEDLTAVDTVLASLSIEYHRPISADETVTVALRVTDLGESSVSMSYELRLSDGTVAATGESVQVAVDETRESSRPLPADWRDRIAEYHDLDADR